jgi:hypothetical protein
MKRASLAAVALAALTLSANAESHLHRMAGSLAVEPQASPSRPLTPVQALDPEHCKARCQRTYDFCLRLVNELANGALRGDVNLLQLQRDRCETNYENCVSSCLR